MLRASCSYQGWSFGFQVQGLGFRATKSAGSGTQNPKAKPLKSLNPDC